MWTYSVRSVGEACRKSIGRFEEDGAQYMWLCTHLPAPTSERTLTEVAILECLEDSDREVVEPWLTEWGEF